METASQANLTFFAALLAQLVEAPGEEDRALAVAGYLRDWSRDEVEVLGWHATRIVQGRARYGHLDLSGDGRRWRHERAEELGDAATYLGHEEIARMLREQVEGPTPLRVVGR